MTSGRLMVAESDGIHVLKFVGDVRVAIGNTIDAFLTDMYGDGNFRSVVIDLTETSSIDSTSLGLLAKISIRVQECFATKPTIVSTNEDVTRVLMSMGFDQVFIIIEEPIQSRAELAELAELAIGNLPESDLRDGVLEAHRVLMNLNEGNQLKFRDLVAALETERSMAS